MLGGLFKRKDKRSKSQEDDVEDGKKSSEELLRESPQPKESLESLSRETQGNKQTPQQQPQRQTSKLQKAPPTKTSLAGKLQQPPRIEQTIQSAPPQEPQSGSLSQPDRAPPGLSENDRIVPKTLSGPVQPSNDNSSIQQVNSNDLPEGTRDLESRDGPRSVTSPTRDVLLLPSEPKPERLKTVNHRLPMDEFDSSPEPEEPPNILPKSEVRDPSAGTNEGTTERLSESPVEVSQPDTLQKQQPPPLVVDTSSQEDPSNSPLSPVSSPELIEAPRDSDEREETPASTAQSSTNTPTWSDANLRAYLEDDSDIRDLLVVVHDKSDVKPANPDHPVVKNLFKEENRRLGEISNQLDGLLGDWLARKPRNTRNQLSK